MLDDNVVHELGKLVAVSCASFERPAIDDDACAPPTRLREDARERDDGSFGTLSFDERRHVFDRELDVGELPAPPILEMFDSVEHEIVEDLSGRPRERNSVGHQRAAQTAAVPVPMPRASTTGAGPARLAHPTRVGRALRHESGDRTRSWPPVARAATVRDVGHLRRCSRAGCGQAAVATLTYVYADRAAVVGPLATYAEPHCYDLCDRHSARLTAPRGWELVRLDPPSSPPRPMGDDLEALANAVREAARAPVEMTDTPVGSGTGRRGHLRVLPTPTE